MDGMMIQFKILGETERAGRLALHETEYQTHEAKLAIRFAEIILSTSDNAKHIAQALHCDDPAANKAILVGVETIAKRACDLASYLRIEMRKREWIIDCPDIDAVYPTIKDR